MKIKIKVILVPLLAVFQLSCSSIANPNTGFNGDPFEKPHIAGIDLGEHVPGEPFSPLDYQNAERLSLFSPPGDRHDPIELAGLFEGDIILSRNHLRMSNDSEHPDAYRNAVNQDKQRWIGGVIPYFISSQFNAIERSVIARAFLEYHKNTCIVFRPKTTEVDYIHIMKGNGCSSNVGRTGGPQAVTLGEGCVYPGIAVHELMHAVGFWHEQSRYDRDDFVNIYFRNIQPGMEFNFKKYSWKDIQNLSVPYDTGSVMHYGPYAFAKDRRYATLLPRIPNDRMGQRDGFSPKDIQKINRLYNCDKDATTTTATTPSTTTTATTTTTSTTTPPPSTVQETTSSDGELNGSTMVAPLNSTDEARCTDSNRFCSKWSNKGECTRNPAWMSVNCRMSCGRCDSSCSDVNTRCPQWAKSGECTRHADYMKVYCAKSCNNCDTGSSAGAGTPLPNIDFPACEDTNKFCEAWAKDGQCKKNPQWMVKNCAKSCNSCVSDAGDEIQNVINASNT